MADSDSESESDVSETPTYFCGCEKLANWDTHQACHKHMGDGHARRLISGINAPECRFCYDLSIEHRRQYVGDYVLIRNSVVRSTQFTAAPLPPPSHAGRSASVVWPDDRSTISEAPWQPAGLASANDAVARWAHQALANHAVSGARSMSSERGDRAERSRVAPIGSRPNVLEHVPSSNPIIENYGGHLAFVPPALPRPLRVRVAAKSRDRASSADSDATFPREGRAAKRIGLEGHAEGSTPVAPTAAILPDMGRVSMSVHVGSPPRSLSLGSQEDLAADEDMEVVESVERVARATSSRELQRLIALLPRALKSARIEDKAEPVLSATAKDFPSVDKTGSKYFECPALPKAIEVLNHAGKNPSTAKTVNASGLHYGMRV